MQLNIKQLHQHLKKSLLPVYLLSGDVPLLLQEARDTIRQTAHHAGYQQYQRLDVEPGFDWSQLTLIARSLSLFSEQTFIELHTPAKFDTEAAKILLAYCESPPADKLLLIVTSKLSGAQQKTRWYQAIIAQGAALPIWPVKTQELPQWIQQRLQTAGLQADMAAIRLLIEYTEGNLLAAQQAIIKLGLLYRDKTIGIREISAVISDSAQFNIFELSHYLLSGDARSTLRVLSHLRSQDTEATLVLWLLARECRELIKMLAQLQQGKSLNAVLSGQWDNLKPLYQAALRRLTIHQLKNLLIDCQQADQIIKGIMPGNAWDAFTKISLQLAGKRIL